ncbi:hypothetical protein Hanom_Chr13g01207301 [Helianthus anomalus]
MDVFMFSLSDLNILYGHKIHVRDGNEYKVEGMLFQRAVERVRERKIETIEILSRIEQKKERDEEKKKKSKEKKKQKYPAQQKDPSPEPVIQESQPPTSSTYEVTLEYPPITSEANVNQPPPKPTVDQAAANTETKANK